MVKSHTKLPTKKSPPPKSSLDSFLTSTVRTPKVTSPKPKRASSSSRIDACPFEPCDIREGWTMKCVPRKPGSKIVAHIDKYYYSPEGEMFRSRKEALRSIGVNEASTKESNAKKKDKLRTSPKKPPIMSKASAKKSHSKSSGPKFTIGTTLSKVFHDPDASNGERSFAGEITEYDRALKLYMVVYEDGDKEELNEAEVEILVDRRKNVKKTAANRSTNKTHELEKKAADKVEKSNGASNNAEQKYGIGSLVSKEFEDDEFGVTRPFDGSVTYYDFKSHSYTVTFENNIVEKMSEASLSNIFKPRFVFSKERINKIVNGKSAVGMIGMFDMKLGKYTVCYKDGTKEYLTESEVSGLLSRGKNGSIATANLNVAEVKSKKKRIVNSADEEESGVYSTDGKPAFIKGRRSCTKNINYRMDSFSDGDESNDDEKPKAKKAKGVSKTKKSIKNDSDSDDFALGVESEDDELIDDTMLSESEEKSATKKTTKTEAGLKKEGPKSTSMDVEKKTKMSDVDGIRKTLKNNPDYFKMSREEIKATQSFLDPCGMEATDDIIDRLVGQQLDRISELLSRALKGGALGSKSNPVVLGTACSGTDAPALALMLNQEQLETRGMGGLFEYDHVFSCEKEPYKQAYLAKNFDSVLYPDIVKLCDDPPRDVYGQEKPLPEFNLFVAGTSCKNFSMMMSNKRLDIEDKGCSGETFLAACELLMKNKPKFAIFENVTKAPWEKMSEYITGRLNLSSIDDSNKSIKGASKGKEGELELIFQDQKILTHKVPSQVGCQCGAVIKGYTNGDSRKIQEVTWPKSTKKSCTLTEFVKHNGINKKTDTLYLETDVVYCTQWLKVDTKDFGLPQTRERTYMFVWQPDDGNVDDDLGQYWQAIVEYLQFPVRHALESFILEANHDVIRAFREALNGPAGRYTMRSINQAPDFWDKSNANANLPHNLNTRAAIGMDEYARPQTKWGAYGKMQVPPHWWLEYTRCVSQRCLDMLDILHASAARDAESHDSNFSSYFWNISQNVSREKHRTSRSGIAGCITPGGDVFLPHAGRPLLGCEKLLLQGIPYFRLLLGNETEVQLGDLAGNAMSLTVVNAAMLAAMTCKQLRVEHKRSVKKSIHATLESLSKLTRPIDSDKDSNDMGIERHLISTYTKSLFQELSNLANEAIKSSIWCTCETSGRTSRTTQFVQCRVCSVACCRDCCHVDQGYQLDSHDIKDVSLASEHDSSSFEIKLRSIMPSSLVLSSEGIDQIASIAKDKYRVRGLENCTFSLHQIKQSRMKWLAIYYARGPKSSETLAELRVIVGEIEKKTDTADQVIGVQAELTSFIPAKRAPFVFGHMDVCARGRQCLGEKDLVWKVRDTDSVTTLSVIGVNPTPSFRIQVGLNDVALEGQFKAIKTQHKAYDQAKKRGEERRWLYVENWRDWPQEITISDCPILCGKYIRVRCQQTINQSACWIRQQSNSASELYLLLKPDVGRTGPDVAVISSSIDATFSSSIIATFPLDWQPSDALIKKTNSVANVSLSIWKDLVMTCFAFTTTCTVESPKIDDSSLLVRINGLSENDITDLCCRDDEFSVQSEVRLNVYRGAKAQQTVRRFNLLCVAEILKHAAAHGLKYEMGLNSSWSKIEAKNVPFGCCTVTLPPRPTETWSYDAEREVWERSGEPGASRKYFVALHTAPQCFVFVVDRKKRSLAIECFPEVAAHHAAYGLIYGRGRGLEKELTVDFRFLSVQEDPVLDRFRLHNCHDLAETNVPLKGGYELYERQKKAVTKMIRIEQEEVEYEEIEMNEQKMPGAAAWSLIARAKRITKLRGGVIADAIGAGKTVISIAITLQGIKAAREKRCFPRKSSATLVVVPPGLIDQWKKEVLKFTDNMPNVICIYDDDALKRYSLKEIIEADMVICPVDLLEATGYMARLARVAAGVKDLKEVPQMPKETGQVEKNGASGVWIPATSQDPFGGANNPRSQQRRNESAYFTHVYHNYICQLREKKFQQYEKGIPLEYFEWERVFIDEIHECLCTSKDEMKEAKTSKDNESGFFKEKNRRAGREFLGITTKDITRRPLVFRKAIFGLTATPLLDSTNRVIELANLMGNAYIIGLSSHWRNLERESGRDIFLSNFLEPKQSREIRKNIYSKCQDYLDLACCKNKNEEDMDGIEKVHIRGTVNMTENEGILYKKSQSGVAVPSYSTRVEDFDVTAGHDISKFLRCNASLVSRGKKLVEICKNVISQEGNERTKIIVFADGRIRAGNVARDILMQEEELGCTWLDENDTVEEKNKKLGWYQYAAVTDEDKKRPRVLVLNFEHAAGLNLQAECNNLILFTPLYGGEGGTSGDVVADVSTEMQAIGRVFRPGQPKSKVYIYRIEVKGPNGEECLDGQLIRRNTDKATEQMAVNADD